VIEPVALGGRAGELVAVDRTLGEQQRLRRSARGAGLFDRLADALLGDVAELDQDVGDEALGATAGDRRGQPRRAAGVGIEPPESGTGRRWLG
jgi:hypothetical protein